METAVTWRQLIYLGFAVAYVFWAFEEKEGE